MSDLNRREVVVAAAVACACACGSTIVDAAEGPGDRAPAAQSTGPVDAGPTSNYPKDGVTDKWSRSQQVLVIRHEGKIYAPSSVCTHRRCMVKAEINPDKAAQQGPIYCGCHGSRYSLQGTAIKGPAKGSLFRYGISVNNEGHIIVDKSKQFAEKNWDDEGASIKA